MVVACTWRSSVQQLIENYTQIGVDEVVFIPAVADLYKVTRLADAVRSSAQGH